MNRKLKIYLHLLKKIYHLAYEVPPSSVSFLRQKFDLHQNSDGGERNRTYATRNRFRATRSSLSATAAPNLFCFGPDQAEDYLFAIPMIRGPFHTKNSLPISTYLFTLFNNTHVSPSLN